MDDEINLANLWNTLVRRRWSIVITALIFTIAAGAYAYLKPVRYAYSTALEVGSYPVETENGRDRRLIEPTENIERKLRLAYIPLATSQIGKSSTNIIPQVRLSKDSGGRLFILTSIGTIRARANIVELHQRILDMLTEDNEKTLHNLMEQQRSIIRTQQATLAHTSQQSVRQAKLKALEEKHQKALQKLAALDQDHAVTMAGFDAKEQIIKANLLSNQASRQQLTSRVTRMKEREELLHEQITAIQHRLTQLQKERDSAIAEASQNANAVAVLMVGSEVTQAERRLWELRNSLAIDLETEREEITRNLADNQGNQTKLTAQLAELNQRRASVSEKLPATKLVVMAEIERLVNDIEKGKQDSQLNINLLDETIQRLESELADVMPTAPLYLAIRDLKPQGPSFGAIVRLGSIIGLFLGTLIAFLSDVTVRPIRH